MRGGVSREAFWVLLLWCVAVSSETALTERGSCDSVQRLTTMWCGERLSHRESANALREDARAGRDCGAAAGCDDVYVGGMWRGKQRATCNSQGDAHGHAVDDLRCPGRVGCGRRRR